jgi:hypothetical protein
MDISTSANRDQYDSMNVEKTIADIELLEHIFTLPDDRTLLVADCKPQSQTENAPDVNILDLWFRPWKRDGT